MSGTTTRAGVRNLSLGGDSGALPARAYPTQQQLPNAPASPSSSAISPQSEGGLLRIVSNASMIEGEQAEQDQQRANEEYNRQLKEQGVAGYIRRRFHDFKSQRETRGISFRLVEALRAYNAEYTPDKLAAIREFGGSEVYARLTAVKCRGATSMLRDIYLSGERPWFVEPTPYPTLPEDVTKGVMELVKIEVQGLLQAGQPVDPAVIQERVAQLTKAAEKAALQNAKEDAVEATRYLDDMLVEGGFYESLTEFLHNLTVFPYAFMKGPVVKMATDVKWVNGEAVIKNLPKMYWTAPSPFDIYWQSGINKFEDGDVIEHLRLCRADLNSLMGIPGYNDDAIREVLLRYGNGGLSDWLDYTDSERAQLEEREDPHLNHSDLIDTLEFHGKIQGQLLLDFGFSAEEVPDAAMDYFCNCWLIDTYVIKLQLDPNPRKRHPYYMTSFEKIPGAIVGHGVAEIMDDIQDVANATLRALVNNLSIASGPQVVVNDDRLAPTADTDNLYPWKRWHTLNDPMGSAEPAIAFFQPQSNSQELLATYQQMTVIGDELSSIPRYMTGSSTGQAGAGRTASGLNMLMQNAGKVMQSVAANIDADIFTPLLQRQYDTVLLTDESGRLKGDEQIRVRGVVFANQRETERARMLEFLSLTANPMDAQIVGMEGRAELLREVADRIGLDFMNIIPDADTIQQQQKADQMSAMQQGNQPPKFGQPDEAGAVDEGLKGQSYGPSGKST